MNKAALLAVGAVVGVAWYVRQKRMTVADIGAALNQGGEFMGKQIEDAASALGSAFGFIRVANMSKVDPSLINNPNVRAMLAVIRRGEGTTGANGYRTIYGGQLFNSFVDHPRIAATRWGRTSTAAGAYQILSDTWDETKKTMGLRDFSPASQDVAALGRIAYRGVLPDVLAGRWERAIKGSGARGHGLRWEWASLPDSPYGQGGISWETARSVYLASGGSPVYA